MAKIIATEYHLEIDYAPLDTMTDDELLQFCAENKILRIERDEKYLLMIMPPVFPFISSINASLTAYLGMWNRHYKLGIHFGSSSGFYLPDGSMRSPDAAWISYERWNALPADKQTGFAYITPDFVVELASPSDSIAQLKIKMEKWRDNGAKLGWLIIPKSETIFIYRANGTVSKVEGFDNTLSGEDILPAFEFRLDILR